MSKGRRPGQGQLFPEALQDAQQRTFLELVPREAERIREAERERVRRMAHGFSFAGDIPSVARAPVPDPTFVRQAIAAGAKVEPKRRRPKPAPDGMVSHSAPCAYARGKACECRCHGRWHKTGRTRVPCLRCAPDVG